jgi:glucosamine--fructose-6-phosphate aminotransferase (isomerizing)
VALIDEIREQPEVAARLLREAPADLRPLVAAVRRRDIAYVLIAARGTSDHAAVYAQYALGAIALLPVALATPSLLTRYGVAPRVGAALVLGISQSGRSPDVVEVLSEARRQGAVTAAITNEPESPLAGAADHVVALRAGAEASVAATKTYSASILAVAMLAAELADDDARRRELAGVPELMRQAAALQGTATAVARRHQAMSDAVVLGRGYHLATALEWALKLKELAYVRAQGYSTADFQHGPAASLAPAGHVLAVSTGRPMRDELIAVLTELRRDRQAHVLLVGGDAGDAALVDAHLPLPSAVPEWLAPLAAIVPIQLFCAALGAARGIDAEHPRGLRKVTLTR